MKFNPDILFAKQLVNNPLLETDLIKDYKTLCKNINLSMDLHSNSTKLIDRNYKIKNVKQIEKLIIIMKEEAKFNRPDVRNALAFLYYYGIGVYKNRNTALQYF